MSALSSTTAHVLPNPDALLRREGVCTWQRLQRAGATRGLARSRLATGRWWRPFNGVYADACTPRTAAAYAKAATLLVPNSAASHGSAIQVWDVKIAEVVRALAEITIDRAAPAVRPRAGLLVHRAAIADHELRLVNGVPVLDPARTVIDLARREPPEIGLAVADAFLRAGRTNLDALQASLAAVAGLRGVVIARRIVALADGRSESPMESICRWQFVSAGLPVPQIQHNYIDRYGSFVARVDFYWPEARLVVEFDGWDSHMGRRDLFASERRKHNRLVADGVLVLRFTAEDILRRPYEVIAQIRAALLARTRC
jgi:very-short-patch-repair endonuclease